MKQLITILFLSISLFAKAQPAGYTAGTFVNWSFNNGVNGTKDHGFFKAAGFDAAPDTLKRVLIHFEGDGETSSTGLTTQSPGKVLNDAGTNWAGTVTRPDGKTVYYMVFTIFNTAGSWIDPYVGDINYFFNNTTNLPDTSLHKCYIITGFSGGPFRAWGTLTDAGFTRENIFGFTGMVSPTVFAPSPIDVTAVSTNKHNLVSRNNDDANGGTPLVAATDYFTDLGGYKQFLIPSSGGHSADNFFSISGSDSSTSRWYLWAMATPPADPPPPPPYVQPYKLTVTEKPFNATGGSKTRNPERLLDGSTTTSFYTNDGQLDGIYFPIKNYFILDSNYTNLRVRAYTTTGGPGIYLKFFNETFTDSATVQAAQGTTPYENWAWIDTSTSKAVTFPVRVVEQTVKASEYTINELEFYGNAESAATVNYFPKTTYTYNTQFKDFFGSNINGDEPDSLFTTKLINNNAHAFYHDTAITGITRGTHKFINNIFGDDMTANFKQMKDSGIKVYYYINGTSAMNRPTPLAPYTTQPEGIYNYYNNEGIKYKNIPWGSDSTDSHQWVDHARLAAMFAIYWGNNTSANSDGYNVTFTGTTPAKGRGTLAGIEIDNEDEAWWMDRTRYNSPQVKIAKLSPVYDSVKAKDNTFEVIDGAMSTPDSQYVKGKALYSYRYRGLNNYPADGLAFNYYITDMGGQGANGNGISPEQGKLLQVMQGFVSVVHRYVGNKKFIYRELGWDATTGNSNYSVPVIFGSTLRKTVANWYLRATHISRLAGVDQLFQYRSRDETNNLASNSDFVLSGQHTGWNINADSSLKRWPLSYGMATTLDVYQHHKGKPEVILNGDSTSVWILKDSAVTGYDTVTYTVWKGTANGSTQSFTINAPSGKTFSYVQKVEPKYDNGVSELGTGSLLGTRTVLSSGSTITGTATETPVSYRVVVADVIQTDNKSIIGTKFKKIIVN